MSRDDYIEVAERIAQFYDKYPDGSLQGEWEYTNRDGEQWLAYKAYAYRTPDDPRPGIGHAWEPIPGRTPFTKGSELMNGETSAWGRALAALGIAVRHGIASANEVRAAEANRTDAPTAVKPPTYPSPSGRGYTPGNDPITQPQVKKLRLEMKLAHIDEVTLNDFTTSVLGFEIPADGLEGLTKHQASQIIDGLTKRSLPAQKIQRSADPIDNDPWEVPNR